MVNELYNSNFMFGTSPKSQKLCAETDGITKLSWLKKTLCDFFPNLYPESSNFELWVDPKDGKQYLRFDWYGRHYQMSTNQAGNVATVTELA